MITITEFTTLFDKLLEICFINNIPPLLPREVFTIGEKHSKLTPEILAACTHRQAKHFFKMTVRENEPHLVFYLLKNQTVLVTYLNKDGIVQLKCRYKTIAEIHANVQSFMAHLLQPWIIPASP